jgi:2-polyprenyl-3-methyl-5-hydroxy-6-metoxy-1,4-benzoquinol methylase
MNNTDLTNKQDWDKYYDSFKTNKPLPFMDIFAKHLKEDPTKSVLEVGCAGGAFLYHIYNEFKYIPYGIDYSEKIELTKIKFERNGALTPTLYLEDLFNWKTNKKFDLVCSFGFVEHFDDLSRVVKKHADLVAPGGLMILTIPHFAHGQYILHWILDRKNLKLHNTTIMNLKSFRKAFADLPFEIEELTYYGTFAFWTEKRDLNFAERIVYRIIQESGKAINRIFGKDFSNFIFSPNIVCVAKRIK